MKKRAFTAFILALAVAFSAVPALAADSGTAAKSGAVLAAFGDSIAAAGAWEKEFEALSGESVINLGVGGETSANGLARLNALSAKKPDVVFVGFGTNDASMDMERYVPVAQYVKNLNAIVDFCLEAGAVPVIITPPPIVDKDYFTRHDKSFFTQFGGANGLVSVYALAARRVAAERGIAVADVNSAFSATDYTKLIADGVHPNAQGYKLYAETVLAAYYHAVRGDVNMDGNIDSTDYAMLKRAVLGTYSLDAPNEKRADVNEDGGVDSTDYAMLKRHVLGTYKIEISEKLEDLPGLPAVIDPVPERFYDPDEVTTDRSALTGRVIDAKLTPDKTDAATMAANTRELQRCVDAANAAGGGTVYCPEGTFYFSQQGVHVRGFEAYVCIPKDNVLVIGAGWRTVFKPVGESEGGLDMFYFNEYADSGFKNPKYLVNADFRNFVIDSELTHARRYTSAGKGFMINLYRDCDFENVVVMNTDGTGFGMDCPINCTIKNCRAKGCGKAATTATVGASGIGMGTGYSEEESILIENCLTVGNKKFGIFFEHQGRFGASRYTAQKLKSIVVRNCVAYDNYIDFGGELAVDCVFENCTVSKDTSAYLRLAFNHHSIRCRFVNCISGFEFSDVAEDDAHREAIYWAADSGITTGAGDNKFGGEGPCLVAQAVTFLYRAAGYPGELKLVNTGEKTYYEDALDWAQKAGIVPSGASLNVGCTKAGFAEMMWKYAGSPAASGSYSAAVNWANANGLFEGDGASVATRAEAVDMLYKYFTE